MVYFDKSGRRIRRPLERRIPRADSNPDEAKARYIRDVAAQHPKFTPEEVYVEIRYVRRRNDITKDLVRRVLGRRRRTFTLWPFRR
ncbi:hypothetical protein ACFWYW_20320 [Nonomuraea sp. NPDC059023]|uniref:hypothetical protein n=1 Tax=unclassified Nonomuraea TaxID=2593643 RepID=UPI0036CC02CB